MEVSALLPLPDGMVIEQIQQNEAQLTVIVISTNLEATCPGCSFPSEHVHSQYQRTVNDVPCGGRTVVLRLRVRKFFCLQLCCPRKVFAERLPDLVRPWARVSNRLLEALKAIGLAASAEVSERLTPRLGMKVKAPTLLRYLRTIPAPPRTDVTVLGLDDFAIKRGDKYGTILINVETGKPLDLLADRTAEAVMPWLASHPEIQVVNRDRASASADAARRVLPHATQVADRYHLVQNLRDYLQQFLDHKRSSLPLVEDTPLTGSQAGPTGRQDSPSDVLASESPPGVDPELSRLTYRERKRRISRDKRVARYEEVMALSRKGMSQRAIANLLHLSSNTVQRYVGATAFPERAEGSAAQRPQGKQKIGPYLPYLREQWDAGLHNNTPLFHEIKERGYTGCQSMVRKVLTEWRRELPAESRPGGPRKPRLFQESRQRRLSSRGASFLMILPPEKFTAKQKQQVSAMCLASSELRAVYLLSQEFVTLLKDRQAQALDDWLKRAKACHVRELTSFVNGIRRDYAAVYAAFSRPESNGATEGHVNKLNYLKRQMFGRAHLDLLRITVLHAL